MSGVSRRRAFIALGLMGASAAVAQLGKPTHRVADNGPKVELDRWFPREFAGWRVDDSLPVILPSPDVQALLNTIYSQILTRTYVNPQGERIMLSVAYGGDQSDATRAHRPEVCYPAQGFQINDNTVNTLGVAGQPLRVRQLMAQQGGRYEPITYWIVVHDKVAVSGTEQKLLQLGFGLKGWIPDGMLVRVSSIDRNEARGHALQARFLNDLAPAIAPALRPRILGMPERA